MNDDDEVKSSELRNKASTFADSSDSGDNGDAVKKGARSSSGSVPEAKKVKSSELRNKASTFADSRDSGDAASKSKDTRSSSGSVHEREAKKDDEPKQPWYKRKYTRYFALRILVRILVVVALILIFTYVDIPLGDWIDDYQAWVDSLGSVGGPFVYFAMATLFSTLSPTGYLPTVVAGASFPLYIAAPIAYFSVNLAALLNVLLVRQCLRPLVLRYYHKRIHGFSGIDRLLKMAPVKTVALFRLPYLGSGFLNYMFSLQEVPMLIYACGNAIGFIPGAVLFSQLGVSARSILQSIADGNPSTSEIVVITVTVVAVLLAIGGIVMLARRYTTRSLQETNDPDSERASLAKDVKRSYSTGSASGQSYEDPEDRIDEQCAQLISEKP